jgi:hypothetical protein
MGKVEGEPRKRLTHQPTPARNIGTIGPLDEVNAKMAAQLAEALGGCVWRKVAALDEGREDSRPDGFREFEGGIVRGGG